MASRLETLAHVSELENCQTVNALPPSVPHSRYATISKDATVIIIGMRACGKTTIGLLAANFLGRSLIDTDRVFERVFQTTIRQYIEENGMDAFRDRESSILIDLLRTHPTGVVIVVGGGIVDRPSNIALLQQWHEKAIVLHIRRDISDVLLYHQRRLPTRNKWMEFKEGYSAVWARRRMLYENSSNFTFMNIATSDYSSSSFLQSLSLKHVEQSLHRFLRSFFHTTSTTQIPSLSWNNPRTTSIVIPINSPILVSPQKTKHGILGADYVTLLIDPKSIESCESDILGHNHKSSSEHNQKEASDVYNDDYFSVVCLRTAHVSHVSRLPIHFAPTYPSDDSHSSKDYISLVSMGFKLCCDFVEISLCLDDHVISMLMSCKFPKTQVVLSFDWPDSMPDLRWQDQKIIELYDRAVRLGADVVRFSKYCSSSSDNYDLALLQSWMSKNSRPNTKIPLRAINRGPKGSMSRYINPVMTPISLRLDDSGAQNGELTYEEIQKALQLSGLALRRQIVNLTVEESRLDEVIPPILLDTISVLREAIYTCLLPYDVVDATIERFEDVTLTATLYGSIVNIPVPSTVPESFSISLSQSAKYSGYVDTIVSLHGDNSLDTTQSSPNVFCFDNLSVASIRGCLRDFLSPINFISPSTGAIIVGASERVASDLLSALKLDGVGRVFLVDCEVSDSKREFWSQDDMKLINLNSLFDIDRYCSTCRPSILFVCGRINKEFTLPSTMLETSAGGVIFDTACCINEQLRGKLPSSWVEVSQTVLARRLAEERLEFFAHKTIDLTALNF